MRSRTLERTLAEAYRREPGLRSDHRDNLEAELLRRYDAGRPSRRARRASRRLAVAGLAAAVLLVLVGNVPVTSSVDLGQLVTVHLPAGSGEPPSSIELVRQLRGYAPAEEVSVSVSRPADGEVVVHLILLGRGIAEDDLIRHLDSRVPQLARGRREVRELRGDLRSTLADRVGRALFSIEIDTEDIEAARRQILSRLAAEGYGDGTTLELRREGEQKQIEVELGDSPR